jgi:hypothetical protein
MKTVQAEEWGIGGQREERELRGNRLRADCKQIGNLKLYTL